ncbi:hypothetical protein SOVF_040120 [Spinacia oleracea]|nr:hypothetical protein SOVF_040120 [Spinacia oleracea]
MTLTQGLFHTILRPIDDGSSTQVKISGSLPSGGDNVGTPVSQEYLENDVCGGS